MKNNDDLIYYEYKGSMTHKKMSRHDRSAQFSPFSALTGFEEEIIKQSRYYDDKIELLDDQKEVLNEKILFLLNTINIEKIVEIEYFEYYENNKGNYIKINDIVKGVEKEKFLILSSNKRIRIKDIININF